MTDEFELIDELALAVGVSAPESQEERNTSTLYQRRVLRKAVELLSSSASPAGSIAVFTYAYDNDSDCLTFYIDGEEAGDWYCAAEPEDMLNEFKRVFMLGLNYKGH